MSDRESEDEPLVEVALEVEQEIGEAEPTEAKAKRHLLVRIGIVLAGLVLLVVGLILIVIPGPGLLVTAIGLALLATEVPFAARLLERVRERLPQDADGKLPRSAIVVMVVMFALATGLSLWWTFRVRGT